MSGNYPNVPSWRFAYDADGTQGFVQKDDGTIISLTHDDLVRLNDESVTGMSTVIQGTTPAGVVARQGEAGALILIFPEHRDLDGWFLSNIEVNTGIPTGGGPVTVQVSSNTTNGIDGTWATIATIASGGQNVSVSPLYRQAIQASTALGIKAVRFLYGTVPSARQARPSAVHLFGEAAPDENPQRLMIWSPNSDQHVGQAYFDWGDTPRASSADKVFRVKNMHSTKSAQSIRVAMNVLTDTVPSVPGQHVLSTDGTTWSPQVNIGTLGPGAISQPIYLRRITPSNAVMGPWAFRLLADPLSWT